MTVSIRRMAPAPGLALAGGMALLALAGCATSPSALPEQRARRDVEAARFAPFEDPLPALPERPRLSDLQAAAERANPGVRAAFEAWSAALERIETATGLPDPRLSFAAFLAELQTRDGPVRGRAGLSQAFPWFGVLAAAGDGALAEAEAAFAQLQAQRRALRADLAQVWWEYDWLRQAIEVTSAHAELLRQIEGVARARFETGRLPQADLIRVQLEFGVVEDRLLTLRDRRHPLSARLAALLGLPAATPVLAWPEEAPAVAAAPLPEAGALGAVDPRLLALDQRVRAAEHGVTMARRDRWPGFVVGVEWNWIDPTSMLGSVDSGADAIAVTFGFELPIWAAKDRARIAEAEARQRADLARRRDLEQRLDAELEDALYRYRDADRRVALYAGSLAPKAEESFRSSLTAYEGGMVPLDALIDAARLLLEFQLSSARAVADRAQALAAVERFFGPLGREE